MGVAQLSACTVRCWGMKISTLSLSLLMATNLVAAYGCSKRDTDQVSESAATAPAEPQSAPPPGPESAASRAAGAPPSGETTAASESGAQVFQTTCAACHGAEATGNIAMGAPNLKDDIWLYGGTAAQISHSVRAGRSGVMPAHKDVLGADKIHILAAYVYGLSH